MSNRLNQEREAMLQPQRIASCKRELENIGIKITYEDDTQLRFMHNGHQVVFFPYSGWHTGKSIKDGRGFKKLFNQLTK